MEHGPDPLIGTRAGNYRLVERLGAGGMGEVYKAVHVEIGSRVAIKVLSAIAAHDRSAQQRFLLEAQAVNRIDHPGVVKILDAGRLDIGRPFLVMELLDGTSFDHLHRTRQLTVDEACHGMIAVLDAVAAAHDAGVLHRDLKPANYFRTRDGRVVVLDFGIAKLMSADAAVRLTSSGTRLGTPNYSAPEQLRGHSVGPETDIYAVGVSLFELVCRRRPFVGTRQQVVMGHLELAPPEPRTLEPTISPALEAVVLTALAKDPARRFGRAAAMREALRAAVASTGEGARPRGRTDGSARRAVTQGSAPRTVTAASARGRRRLGIALAAFGVLTAIAIVLVMTLDRAPAMLPDAGVRPARDAGVVAIDAAIDAARDAAPRDASGSHDAGSRPRAQPPRPATGPVGWALIETGEPGATIRVDGKSIGKTPWTGQLPLGRHEIVLAAPGYETATTSIEVEEDWTASVHLDLTKI